MQILLATFYHFAIFQEGVGGGQGSSKYGQEGASRYKPDAKLLSSEPSRGLKWVKDPSKSYPHILMTYSKHLDV